jgi:uncharacterized protein YaiI (UPF0178 family)
VNDEFAGQHGQALRIKLDELGNTTGGPARFEKRDSSRFLQQMDNLIQAAFRVKRQRN